MTDEPDDDELGEIAVELESQELHLADGECWIIDPECLDPDTESEGVIAVQYREGGLYYMTGQAHKWMNAETQTKGKRGDVRAIKQEPK